ncbi:MAG: MFS transporter [Acidimicrobiales bacterium]
MSRIDHRSIAVLGLVTICSYGSWYYGSASCSTRSGSTPDGTNRRSPHRSAGTVAIGCFSSAADAFSTEWATVWCRAWPDSWGGGAGARAFAHHLPVFFLGATIGLGTFGSLAFYHVTMTTAVRLNPDQPTRAIAVLTMWGAFASATFLPLTAWLVDTTDWRTTVRILAVLAGTVLVLAGLGLPAVPDDETDATPLPLRDVIRATVGERGPRLFTAAVAFGGIAMSTLLVYQVPIMTTAGLSATTAATMAGLRGFAQIGGRVPLAPIVDRLGSDRSLMLAFAAIGAGGALVSVAGTFVVAIVFAAVAGFGIGAFSPLQGMKSEELFDRRQLGATMGFYGSVLLLVGSTGPVAAGVVAERTGERRWVSLIVITAAGLATIATWLAAVPLGYRLDDDGSRRSARPGLRDRAPPPHLRAGNGGLRRAGRWRHPPPPAGRRNRHGRHVFPAWRTCRPR